MTLDEIEEDVLDCDEKILSGAALRFYDYLQNLLPIAKAAMKVINTEELSGAWDEAMNGLEEAVKGLEQ